MVIDMGVHELDGVQEAMNLTQVGCRFLQLLLVAVITGTRV
jgi:hypothetical protein